MTAIYTLINDSTVYIDYARLINEVNERGHVYELVGADEVWDTTPGAMHAYAGKAHYTLTIERDYTHRDAGVTVLLARLMPEDTMPSTVAVHEFCAPLDYEGMPLDFGNDDVDRRIGEWASVVGDMIDDAWDGLVSHSRNWRYDVAIDIARVAFWASFRAACERWAARNAASSGE